MKELTRAMNAFSHVQPCLERKKLEKKTVFMNHPAMTFETITPFLKGIYLTLNSWRSGRDDGDWKIAPKR